MNVMNAGDAKMNIHGKVVIQDLMSALPMATTVPRHCLKPMPAVQA